jgi:hypothetical protein
MVKVGSAIAGFWLQRGTAQLAYSIQLWMRLAAADNWQKRLEIQNSFLRDSFTQLNEGRSRYADEAYGIVASSRHVRNGIVLNKSRV